MDLAFLFWGAFIYYLCCGGAEPGTVCASLLPSRESWTRTQAIRLDEKYLHTLGHLAGPPPTLYLFNPSAHGKYVPRVLVDPGNCVW